LLILERVTTGRPYCGNDTMDPHSPGPTYYASCIDLEQWLHLSPIKREHGCIHAMAHGPKVYRYRADRPDVVCYLAGNNAFGFSVQPVPLAFFMLTRRQI